MRRIALFTLPLTALILTACATTGMQFTPEGGPYSKRVAPDQIQILETEPGGRPYTRVGQITWDYTHKKFEIPELKEVLPELKQKASEAGGDAIIVRQANFMGQPAPDKPLHVRADVIRWKP